MMRMRFTPALRHAQRIELTPRMRFDMEVLRASHDDLAEMILREAEANPLLVARDPFAANRVWDGRVRRRHADGSVPSLEERPARPGGLQEHLLAQLGTMDLAPVERRVAAVLVGELSADGYLGASLSEIAELAGVPLETAERVLAGVQELDPAGVAARDLSECLAIQLRQRGFAEDAPPMQIARHYLPLVAQRRFDRVAQALGLDRDAVASAVAVLVQLEPKPGRVFGGDEALAVCPDVFVERVGTEWVVTLNDGGLPRIRMSRRLHGTLEQAGGAPHVQRWVDDRLRSARELLDAIARRQRTLHRVATTLVHLQPEFLDRGPGALRPLTLGDVAGLLGVHESTISRAVAGKYAETPLGVIPLKRFFASGVSGAAGRALSADAIKARLARVIDAEQTALSDQAVRDRLAGEGIHVSRRTVQSYREALGILPASLRRAG